MKKILLIVLIVAVSVQLVLGESARKKKKQEKKAEKTKSGCRIKLPDDIPENEPLYLLEKKGVYSLFMPVAKETIFKPKEELWLFCPGKGNTISGSKTVNMTKLTCLDSKKFGLNGKQPVSFKTLNCTKEVSGDLRVTDRTCADGQGTIMELGFKMNAKVFLKTFETCYNTSTASAIYSQHQIFGKIIQHNVPEDERRTFKGTGVPKIARPSESYKRQAQIERFTEIFGENQQFFNSTSFLVKGHLSPDADFVFSSGQFSTYFYVNVAPQWQAINQGNWLQVEKLARMLAQRTSTDLTVYTGVHDKLNLPSERTGRRTLYIEEGDRIEVPKWFWKILHNETSDSAIVLMTLNNPHAKLVEAQGFCNNICSSVGLISAGLKRLAKGFTYCCELGDFRKTVTTIPKELTAKNLLELSNISFG